MKLGISELLSIPHLDVLNAERLKGRHITGVSTDSRTTNPGDLFIAIRGGNFDGHRFVSQASERGAVALVVEEPSIKHSEELPSTILVVEDTTRALGQLAHMYRMMFDIPVVAIGGSNGKTTTKEMVAQVLATKYSVLGTEGNLNNHIGVPRTLFRLEKKHDVAVVEIGTNHPGEVEYLCAMLQPTHGLITNVGREHLEFFKTLQGVADEEAALFESLRRSRKGHAIINGDDEHVVAKARSLKRRFTYGFKGRGLDLKGRRLGVDDAGCAHLHIRPKAARNGFEVTLRIPGEHNAINALAAAAVGMALRVPRKSIARSLEEFRPVGKRMQLLNMNGVVVYNDTYNANPDSTIAALRTLAAARVPGKKIAVLADMRELGPTGPDEHLQVGRQAGRLGIEYVLTFGELAKFIHDGAGHSNAIHYEQKNMLAEYLAELVSPGDAVLVKGSRGMKMEDVVTFLEERLKSARVARA